MLRRIFPLVLLFCTSALYSAVSGQNCNPPAITANSHIYNIFSPEQEMILGDLNYQRMSGDSRFIQDDKLLAYVNQIGATNQSSSSRRIVSDCLRWLQPVSTQMLFPNSSHGSLKRSEIGKLVHKYIWKVESEREALARNGQGHRAASCSVS